MTGEAFFLTKAIPVAKAGRDSATRKVLLSRIAASRRMDRCLQDECPHRLAVPDAAGTPRFKPSCTRVPGPNALPHSGRRWSLLRLRQMLAAGSICNGARTSFCRSHDADVVLFGTAAEATVSSAIASELRRPPDRPDRENHDRRIARPALAVSSLPGKRFRRDARRRGRRPAGGCHLWSNRSGWNRTGHTPLQHRPTKALLQSLLPATLPHGPPLHESGHAGNGGSSHARPARGGDFCLTQTLSNRRVPFSRRHPCRRSRLLESSRPISYVSLCGPGHPT